MRRVAAIALAVALAAACSGDDDPEAEGLTAAEAEDAVEQAVLDEDDLGEGWDDADPPEDNPFGRCFEGIASTLAASGELAFARDGDGPVAVTRLLMGTVAVEDESAIDPLLARFEEASLPTCLATAFEDAAGETELGFEMGEVTVEQDYVAIDGVRSGHVRIPFHASAPGFDFDAELDLVVVSRGQLVSTVVTTALGELVDGEDIARWASLLADRQRIDE